MKQRVFRPRVRRRKKRDSPWEGKESGEKERDEEAGHGKGLVPGGANMFLGGGGREGCWGRTKKGGAALAKTHGVTGTRHRRGKKNRSENSCPILGMEEKKKQQCNPGLPFGFGPKKGVKKEHREVKYCVSRAKIVLKVGGRILPNSSEIK